MAQIKPAEPTIAVWRQLDELRSAVGNSPFTMAQANSIGLSHGRVRRLVDRGLVAQVLFGVYRIGHAPLDLSGRAQSAGPVLPPGGAVARRTAAWLYGVDPRSPDERDEVMDVECIVPRSENPRRRPGLRCFRTDIDPGDLTEVQGSKCTTPTRTAADLLRWLRPPDGLAVVDAMAASQLIAPQDVIEMLERWPGERFVAQARRLASWVDPLTESFGESWLRLRILDAGFPCPTAQIPIHDHTGRVIYRLDLGWPQWRIGVEYDGREFHSSQPDLKRDEGRRERLAKEFGWNVVGVGLGEVFGRDMRLELGIGELLGMEPAISRRAW